MSAGCVEAAERVAAAWQVLHAVPDPELPALSVVDLGIVREVVEGGGGVLRVVLTPTYSGCPATEAIEADIRSACEHAGLGPVQIAYRLAPPWTSDWLSAEGRRKLAACGIAPPRAATAPGTAVVHWVARPVACPRCGSAHTERLSAFGSTACKALHRCLACREPFDHFKPF